MAKPMGETTRAILWDLSIRGDINENHKDGDAKDTLGKRISTHGIPMPLPDFASKLNYLESKGQIEVLRQGSRIKAIRLKRKQLDDVANPFPDVVQAPQLELVEPTAAPVVTMPADLRARPIADRLAIIRDLSASVDEDLQLVSNALGSR